MFDALAKHGHCWALFKEIRNDDGPLLVAAREIVSAAKEALRLLEAGVVAGVAVGEGIRVKQ